MKNKIKTHKESRKRLKITKNKKIMHKKGVWTGVGDEGGFAPNLKSPDEALDLLIEAIGSAGYEPGKDISIALDVAASEFYDDDTSRYVFKKGSRDSFTAQQLIALYDGWLKKYPIVSIEDGLDENDWAGWTDMTVQLGGKVQLVGDDLFVTNV